MLKNSVRMNVSYIIRRKSTIFTIAILMLYVILNFFYNITRNADIQYISQMYDLIKIGGLSSYQPYIYFLLEYWPLLLMLPSAYIHLNDKNTNICTYMIARSGERNYYYGKAIAVFLVTFCVFSIPFLLELGISCISFDFKSLGCPTNLDYIQSIEMDRQIFLADLYFINRLLYAIVCIVIFAMVTGILATFNYAISTIRFFKYKIFTFLPIYILIYLITYIEQLVKLPYTGNYFLILPMFETVNRNDVVYALFLIICVISSIFLIENRIRRNEIR